MQKLLISILLLLTSEHHTFALKIEMNDWLKSGEISMKKWEFNDAIFYFTRAIEENPHEVKAYLLRSQAYHVIDKYHEATADYQKALLLDQNFVHSYLKDKKKKGRIGMLLADHSNNKLPLNER